MDVSTPKAVKDNPLHEEVMPGVWANVDIHKYHHQIEGESKTSICHAAKSIKHYLMAKSAPPLSGPPIWKGSSLHDLTLLPEYHKEHYIVGPTKTRKAKAWLDFAKDNPDKTILTQQETDEVYWMRNALYANPGMKPYLESKTTLREVCMFARHPATNILLKVRPDLIADGWIIDLKSTSGDVNPRGVSQNIWKYDYWVQDPLYTDVAEMVGLKVKGFLFFFVRSKAPFLTAIYKLNADWANEGRCKYNWALDRLAQYQLSDDKWDGLPRGREVVEL